MADDELSLGAVFPAAGNDEWMKLVDKVLAGAPFDRKLVTTTYEGLKIQPLYVDGDGPGPDAAGLPGFAPHVRGRSPLATGWDVRQYHQGSDLAALNRAILTDLERGVTSIVLGDCSITELDQLDRALDGVFLELAAVCLDWGPDNATGADLLSRLWERRNVGSDAARGEFGLDPLGALARHGWSARPLADALAELGDIAARTARDWPLVRAVRVDASGYADAGGSDALELATALATGVAYLRAMIDAGLTLSDALGQISFRFTATADQFATMAKLRSARRCWARVVDAIAAANAGSASAATPNGAAYIHAVTACNMFSQRDPWVNMLRATLGCFGAAAAGADAITVVPFGAAAGHWDELGVRLARNTQIILAEESGLDRVTDPAGGSWYVESRSEALANAAWNLFRDIEAAGGMTEALVSGRIGADVEDTWRSRLANLARRKDPLTGISEFPNLNEERLTPIGSLGVQRAEAADAAVRIEPLPLRRLAQPFEALRDRADELAEGEMGRPAVFLANLGPIATHTARAAFATNFFEVGGIRTVGNDGFADADAAASAFRASGLSMAAICSSDELYALHGEATARALKASGCATVFLAGNPGDRREAYAAAGVDEFIYVGADLLQVLHAVLHPS